MTMAMVLMMTMAMVTDGGASGCESWWRRGRRRRGSEQCEHQWEILQSGKMIWAVFLLVILQKLIQLEKSTIVRLYEKYLVDFRMFGYESQVIPGIKSFDYWSFETIFEQVRKYINMGRWQKIGVFFPFVFCKLNIFIFLVSVSENNTKNIQIEKIKTFHDVGHFSYFDSVWTVCFT